MMKKIITLGIAIFMLFSLAACNKVTLAQYKTDAKASLDTHVATKVEADYSGDNWAKILGFTATGKTAIDDAADKAGVDGAVATAKTAINGVEKEADMGVFYSLQRAHDNNWLTVEDLRSIAYYYSFTVTDSGSNNPENFVPEPKTPEILGEEIETEIKQTYLNELQRKVPEATLEDVRIAYYFGTYGNCGVIAEPQSELLIDGTNRAHSHNGQGCDDH
ncbi:MAG: hypothetical protein M0R40_11095 [Firmicutes bacterium]|nr:hypothetical protein [Bacillota bacterium]